MLGTAHTRVAWLTSVCILGKAKKYSSAIAYALPALGREALFVKRGKQRQSNILMKARMCFVAPYRIQKIDLLPALPFLFDYNLGRTKAITTESSVVLVFSPLVLLM